MQQEYDYPRFPCPCCGNYTYPTPAGSDAGFRCPVCRQEHDRTRWTRQPYENELPPVIRDEGRPLGFYGGDRPLFTANTVLPTIHSPRDLYRALLHCWSLETCASRMRHHWSPDNPTLGQCSITSFIAQDLFGGRVYGVPLPNGYFHCYNRVGDDVFDLTSEQFRGEALNYENNPEQFREDHFAMPEKQARYETLKAALLRYLGV